MKTKRRINEKTIEKAFNYLEELHHVLTITDVVNLTKLSTAHKVSKTYGTLLLTNNLLVRTKSGAMRWATIEPSREMAIELVRRANEYSTNSIAKRNENKEQVAMNFTKKKKKFQKQLLQRKKNKPKKHLIYFGGY
jgi:regulation of enolase protein 1 (concanavalin A-like superfamily)